MARNKKEALAQFHRESIVKAAERLFMEHGVPRTTMDDIAKEAGYSKSTIYVYFDSKDEICDAVTYGAMTLFKDCIARALASQKGFFEQYRAVCQALVDFQESHPFLFDRLLEEINFVVRPDETSPSLRHDIFVAGEELNAIICGFVGQGIEEGVVRPDILLPQTVLVIWSSLAGLVRLAANKETYITQSMNITKADFLEYGFRVLRRSFEK